MTDNLIRNMSISGTISVLGIEVSLNGNIKSDKYLDNYSFNYIDSGKSIYVRVDNGIANITMPSDYCNYSMIESAKESCSAVMKKEFEAYGSWV